MNGAEPRGELELGPSFYRAHGLGNDYLVFEGVPPGTGWRPRPPALRIVCDRWRGVGADGIVVLTDPEAPPPFPLRMFNPDGTEFERSGNGLRILASHLRRAGRVGEESFLVESGGSRIGMRVHGVSSEGEHDVSVEMGVAQTGWEAAAFDDAHLEGRQLRHPTRGPLEFQPVSVGNPHAVVFADDLSEEALADVGPFLSAHPGFRYGTNVQLARVTGMGALRIAIWERGVGRTSASGTSSCAAAVAAVHRGLLEPGEITVSMPGGELLVRVTPELDVTLRGPVREVATGRLTDGFLEHLGDVGDEET